MRLRSQTRGKLIMMCSSRVFHLLNDPTSQLIQPQPDTLVP